MVLPNPAVGGDKDAWGTKLNAKLDDHETRIGVAQRVNPGNIGTRVFGGRMGTYNNTTASTFQLTMEVAQDFDSIRVIFANTQTNLSDATVNVSASVMSSIADPNNAGGTWATVTKGALSRIATAISPGANRIGYTVTDWIPLSSIARTDGGTFPLVVIRAYISANPVLPVYGNGTDDFTNWASRTAGHKCVSRAMTGDGITTPANFVSTTNISQNPVVGIQYAARGRVITVMGVGDSITEGRGTYLNEGFILPACEALSSTSGTAIEYSNAGWNGQTMAQFTERAIDLLESHIRPDVLVLPSGSPNDQVTTVTAAEILTFQSFRARILSTCQKVGTRLVLWTWLPSNAAIRPYGSSDALRVADNTAVLGLNARGILVADTSTAFSGVTTSGQVQILSGASSDDIHPNDTGNALLRDVLEPVLRRALGV